MFLRSFLNVCSFIFIGIIEEHKITGYKKICICALATQSQAVMKNSHENGSNITFTQNCGNHVIKAILQFAFGELFFCFPSGFQHISLATHLIFLFYHTTYCYGYHFWWVIICSESDERRPPGDVHIRRLNDVCCGRPFAF